MVFAPPHRGPRRAPLQAAAAVLSCAFLVALFAPGLAAAGDDAGPPPAQVLLDLPLPAAVEWVHTTDVGVMLVYAGTELHLIDLLEAKPVVTKTLALPRLASAASLISIPGTGIVVTAGEEGGESLAIDAVTGEILWERPALGEGNLVTPFLEHGLLVLQRYKPSRRTLALDLISGETLWERTDVWRVWSEGAHVGVAADAVYTLDPRGGDVLRRAEIPIENKQRLLVYPEAERAVVWDGRYFFAYAYPPYSGPTATGETPTLAPEKLWKAKADSPIKRGCIRNGGCAVLDAGPDRMLVRSALRYEIVDLEDGRRLWTRKRGLLSTTALEISPSQRLAALATSDGFELVDVESGKLLREARYPRGHSKGSKLMKRASWLDEDTFLTVFPDKKGEPRGMCAFSAESDEPLWALELPKSARYNLTSDERQRLVARIAFSLVMTAVSVNNPISYGSTSYVVVTVPNINVSERTRRSLDASGLERADALRERFADASERAQRVRELREERARRQRYYVTGWKGDHVIHRVDLVNGRTTPLVSHEADAVHSIFGDPAYEIAVAVEQNKTRLRILSLRV